MESLKHLLFPGSTLNFIVIAYKGIISRIKFNIIIKNNILILLKSVITHKNLLSSNAVTKLPIAPINPSCEIK